MYVLKRKQPWLPSQHPRSPVCLHGLAHQQHARRQRAVTAERRRLPQVDGNKELPAHTSMRGAYINTGSRDAGPDRPITELVK